MTGVFRSRNIALGGCAALIATFVFVAYSEQWKWTDGSSLPAAKKVTRVSWRLRGSLPGLSDATLEDQMGQIGQALGALAQRAERIEQALENAAAALQAEREAYSVDNFTGADSLAAPRGSAGIPRQMETGHLLDAGRYLRAAQATLDVAGVAVSEECSAAVGPRFLEEWRIGRRRHCVPPASLLASQGPVSSVECFTRPATSEMPFTLCHARNAVLADLGALMQDFEGPPKYEIGANPDHLGSGALRLACSAAGSEASAEELRARMAANWFRQGGAVTYEDYGAVREHCINFDSGRPTEAPVLFLARWSVTNLFHFTEDLITTFLSLLLLELPAPERGRGLEVVLLGGDGPEPGPGPFGEAMRRLAAPAPLVTHGLDALPANRCIAHSVHSQFGGVSLLSYTGVGAPSTCESVLVQAFALWWRAMFADVVSVPEDETPRPVSGSLGRAAAASVIPQNRGVRDLTILWSSRALFEHLRAANLTGWQEGRVLNNETELVLHLQRTVDNWNHRHCYRARAEGAPTCRVLFRLQTMEFSNVHFTQQLAATSKAAIFLGVHGAGMTHALFMRPRAGSVIEVRNGGTAQSYHYHNIAHWAGHRYRSLLAADPSALGGALMDAMSEVAVREAGPEALAQRHR